MKESASNNGRGPRPRNGGYDNGERPDAFWHVVLAEDIDRLARNQADGARLFERLAFLGIPVWTVADGDMVDAAYGPATK